MKYDFSNLFAAALLIGWVSFSHVSEAAIYGDLDGNGVVDLTDVGLVNDAYGAEPLAVQADIAPCGGDGIVDINDILAVLEAYSGKYRCHSSSPVAPVPFPARYSWENLSLAGTLIDGDGLLFIDTNRQIGRYDLQDHSREIMGSLANDANFFGLVSDDGSYIAGDLWRSSGLPSPTQISHPFVWSQATGVIDLFPYIPNAQSYLPQPPDPRFNGTASYRLLINAVNNRGQALVQGYQMGRSDFFFLDTASRRTTLIPPFDPACNRNRHCSMAVALNDQGRVIGNGYVYSPYGNFFSWKPFIWWDTRDGTRDGMKALPLPPGTISGRVTGFDDSGRVVGLTYASDYTSYLTLWSAQGTAEILVSPNGYGFAYSDMNDRGEITGQMFNSQGKATVFIYNSEDGARDLAPMVMGLPSHYQLKYATQINNSGCLTVIAHNTITNKLVSLALKPVY